MAGLSLLSEITSDRFLCLEFLYLLALLMAVFFRIWWEWSHLWKVLWQQHNPCPKGDAQRTGVGSIPHRSQHCGHWICCHLPVNLWVNCPSTDLCGVCAKHSHFTGLIVSCSTSPSWFVHVFSVWMHRGHLTQTPKTQCVVGMTCTGFLGPWTLTLLTQSMGKQNFCLKHWK